MMSAATPSSSNFIHDFTSRSTFIPAFSATKENSENVLANDVRSQTGIMHSPSFLELPTLKHVSKAFQIEVWFLAYIPGNLPCIATNCKIILLSSSQSNLSPLLLHKNTISYRWHDFI